MWKKKTMFGATCACFGSKQEEEKASERRASKCIEWQEDPGAGFSDGQTGRPATYTEVVKCEHSSASVEGASDNLIRQLCTDVHLSCSTRVAERQGKSSRVWRSSSAVPVVTREGRRSTKSSTNAGLSHANSCKRREKECSWLFTNVDIQGHFFGVHL